LSSAISLTCPGQDATTKVGFQRISPLVPEEDLKPTPESPRDWDNPDRSPFNPASCLLD
jgi:hypothetical protein